MESSNHVTDEQLLESIESLSRKLSYVYKLDFDLQQEIKQEISLALLRARERFDHKRASWKTYSEKVANYTVYDYFRNNQINGQKWVRATRSPVRVVSLESVVREPSVDETYEHLYVNEFLEICRNPRERFVALCLLAGYTQADIERLLNQKPGSLSKSIQRLRIVSSKYSSFLQTD